ncbi:MAG TPA: type IV toxin-antitoxin system AbiEi family antitoxin domain-containing protein [Solirubrobacterales bacterium]|nr:type IV toxin-antitoxin system AbiEi family antitoxin domain-containing protein [Solirubrobacterales bacterium]
MATYLSHMGRKVAKADVRLAEIAEKQYGVVAVAQLHRLGLDEKAIRRRVDAGHLHRVHRGVYAVGHVGLSPKGRWFAAVLAIGRGPHRAGKTVLEYWGAAVSHRSAAALWELLPVLEAPTDVIVDGTGGRAARAGIRVHRAISLVAAEVTLRHGIPVTSPLRTISDVRRATGREAGKVSAWELRKAIRQANVLGLPIDAEDQADRTRSDLETDFLTICRRHRLPRPEINVRVGPFLVDFLWREERLVVETDGYRYHRGRLAFQDDRGRELELMRLGYGVLHLSEAQIDEAPKSVGEVLGAELRKRRDA